MPKPSISRAVHYVARGSKDGVFPPACRAATVTETDESNPERVGVMVANPTGLFFYSLAAGGVRQDEKDHAPGTWHWPERVAD
jgi:hypothetical protein